MTATICSNKRWRILVIGVAAMLFAGIIYAWSILKVPFADDLGFSGQTLALNFTLTMSFFCIGGVISGGIVRRIGTRITIILAGFLAGSGLVLAGLIGYKDPLLLYLTYALTSGFGIGMAYIVIISTVNAWFPDKKGLSSGALMMGFGASTLILGNLAAKLFTSSLGWKNTYVLIGAAIGIAIVISSFFIYPPQKNEPLPALNQKSSAHETGFEQHDYKPIEMLRRFTFWRAFLALICITAVGNSIISFARDLALSVEIKATVATTLVGILAICNGLGRILTGVIFDTFGRRFTMIAANILTIIAATVMLLSVALSLPILCIIGLCITGLSYGTSPTVCSTFILTFYGKKHFATNLGIANFNLMGASIIATVCTTLQVNNQTYVTPCILLLVLSLFALGLNLSIKRP